MKGNAFEAARSLAKRTENAVDDTLEHHVMMRDTSEMIHPSARRKPMPMSMAPQEGNKRKHYGRPFDEAEK